MFVSTTQTLTADGWLNTVVGITPHESIPDRYVVMLSGGNTLRGKYVTMACGLAFRKDDDSRWKIYDAVVGSENMKKVYWRADRTK